MRRHRRRNPHAVSFAFSAVLAAALLAPAAAGADEIVRTLSKDLPAAGIDAVDFHGQVGEVQVVGTSGDSIEIEVALRCDTRNDRKCKESADRVDLEVRRSGDRVKIEVEDWPKLGGRLSIRARLEIPKDRAVEIDMGVGEVSVSGIEADVEVDTGVGEVSVEGPESAFRSVNLDAGVGEVELVLGGRTVEGSGFVGGHLSWRDGPGEAHIEIDTGVGEIRVILR